MKATNLFFFAKRSLMNLLLFVVAVVFVSASQDPLPPLVFSAKFFPTYIHGKGAFASKEFKDLLSDQIKFCRSESVQNQVEVLEDSRYFGVEYGISEKMKEEDKNIDEENWYSYDDFEKEEPKAEKVSHKVLYMNNCIREDLYSTIRRLAQQVTESKYNHFQLHWNDSLHAQTIEIINYTVGNSLGWHVDVGGTVLTMVIMLSEPNVDFTGGELEFMDSQHLFNSEIQEQEMNDTPIKDSDFDTFRKTLDWHKGDFVVFPITSAHRVKPVLSGHRSTFVIEFKYGIYYGLNPHLTYPLDEQSS
ncbi:hypothetical protein RFI_05819 [Reticulomyxa filosa]|uniref:Fe2OG dioxygenase domain-containing protein n=1 Tax=Reticulomyxa filosa TaxID=46433 RepID=X6NZB0_RETFI|nr:hypothetical protein RFI_05819 [Reticulomyxa filosa]|eukprot:ETO31301.1 hypothetical protein RFI_05819 [Reticulomyxa filosa]